LRHLAPYRGVLSSGLLLNSAQGDRPVPGRLAEEGWWRRPHGTDLGTRGRVFRGDRCCNSLAADIRGDDRRGAVSFPLPSEVHACRTPRRSCPRRGAVWAPCHRTHNQSPGSRGVASQTSLRASAPRGRRSRRFAPRPSRDGDDGDAPCTAPASLSTIRAARGRACRVVHRRSPHQRLSR
jgi:hypothetical protein